MNIVQKAKNFKIIKEYTYTGCFMVTYLSMFMDNEDILETFYYLIMTPDPTLRRCHLNQKVIFSLIFLMDHPLYC